MQALVDGRPRNAEWLRRHGLRRCHACKEAKPVGEYESLHSRTCERCRIGVRVCRVCGIEKPCTEYGYRRTTCHDCEPIPYGEARKPRACLRCHKVKPVTAFAQGNGRRRGVCNDCLDAEATEKARRAQERESRRSTYTDPTTGRLIRRCTKCKEPKDLLNNYYVARRDDAGEPVAYDYYCHPCRIEHSSNRLRERRKGSVAVRAQYAAYQKAWRENHPEEHKAAQARWTANRRADPARHAAYLEDQRIRYRLKREAEGHTLRCNPRVTMGSDDLPLLPAKPLGDLLYAFAEDSGDGLTKICAAHGASARSARSWHNGERKSVQFDVADRVLTAAGLVWWEVWGAEDYPDVHRLLSET